MVINLTFNELSTTQALNTRSLKTPKKPGHSENPRDRDKSAGTHVRFAPPGQSGFYGNITTFSEGD